MLLRCWCRSDVPYLLPINFLALSLPRRYTMVLPNVSAPPAPTQRNNEAASGCVLFSFADVGPQVHHVSLKSLPFSPTIYMLLRHLCRDA